MASYKKINHKYKLTSPIQLQSTVYPLREIQTPFINLKPNGKLFIDVNYAWDGASGPTIDTDNTIVPSAGHDALFQLMRQNLIDRDVWFLTANKDICRWMKDRKMSSLRANAWKTGLDIFGFKHTLHKEDKIIKVF